VSPPFIDPLPSLLPFLRLDHHLHALLPFVSDDLVSGSGVRIASDCLGI
jgi:hypothetical protein